MFELKNGAQVEYITMRRVDRANGGLEGCVLAKWLDEWVVWTVDGEGNCYNGGYHGTDIHTALDEYRERSAGAR